MARALFFFMSCPRPHQSVHTKARHRYTVSPMAPPKNVPCRLAKVQARCEREFLLAALKTHHGHNSRTALWLGISRRALYDKMREHGLEGEASGMHAEAGIVGPRTRMER